MDALWIFVIMFVCLLSEGFFSGSEIALISADPMKLRHSAAKGSRGAKLALRMLKRPEWLLSTTLLGTNISVVTNTTVATTLMIRVFGEQGGWYAILLAAPLIWVFGEIVPKSVFQQRADVITPYAVFVLRFVSYLFYPLLIVLTFVTGMFTRFFGRESQNPFTLREEIITMLQMPAGRGDIQSTEEAIIRRMFGFSDTKAYEIMVPLIDVVAIEKGANARQATTLAGEKAHIRLLVYEGRIDRVVGTLNALELLDIEPEQPIEPHIRPVRFVPMSKHISGLLLELRKDPNAVAVVVDEFGGTVGLVTIEDIMEEMVEDIEDEYDAQNISVQWVRKISKNEYVVSARIEIDTLAEKLGIRLPKGKYATLAGFLLEKEGEIPPPGTLIRVKGISFTIESSSPQAIQEVCVRW